MGNEDLKLPRVLVADDEADIGDALVRKLTRRGYQAHAVRSGNQALEYCRNHPVDVVITDIRMPDGTGLELVQSLRAIWQAARPAVIAMSAFSDMSLEEAYERGVDALFSKPLDLEGLMAAVTQLHNQRLERIALANLATLARDQSGANR